MITSAEARLETLQTELAAEQALRIAAEQQAAEAEKRVALWYRRAMLAEDALDPILQHWDDTNPIVFGEPCAIPDDLLRDAQKAAELRDDIRTANYEDFLRDRRQTKCLLWALKTYGDGPGGDLSAEVMSPVERAWRFFEEAVELLQAVLNADHAKRWPALATSRPGYLRWEVRAKALNFVRKIFKKEPGQVREEAGDVIFTLNMIAEVHGFSLCDAERMALAKAYTIKDGPERWARKRALGM